ncbi:MAG TPA: hypothetical protein VD969_13235 [Symbiobacteriaceae bacterium]|nr:hypothetical protein [Symbiobacteriaceae bacterium]
MFFDWIMGVALRPRVTFERSREHLRFGYWWIVLTVMSLDAVMGIFHPESVFGREAWVDATLFVVMFDLFIFDLQALMLLGAGRVLGWSLTWPQAVKFCGLLWSINVLEDLFVFYPSLKAIAQIELWTMGFFSIWYVIVMAIGVRRISGLSGWKTLVVTLLAGATWRTAFFALAYYSLKS